MLLIARREDRLQSLAAELIAKHGIIATTLTLDLADGDAAERIAAAVQATGRPLKWLINNAGFALAGRFDSISLDRHRQFLRVMAGAPVEVTHALIPALKKAAPSHVVNVASIGAYIPGNLYGGVKSMILRFSEMLSRELRADGVTVTASCPGATATEIFERAGIVGSKVGSKVAAPVGPVVREAIAAAERGRVSIVHGRDNWWTAFMFRHLPEAVGRAIVTRRLTPPKPRKA